MLNSALTNAPAESHNSDSTPTNLNTSGLLGKTFPPLGQCTDPDRLPRIRNLVPAILDHSDPAQRLRSLSDRSKMGRFVQVLLRSETECRDLLIDRVRDAQEFLELLDNDKISDDEQMQGLRGIACSPLGYPLTPGSPQYLSSWLHGLSFRELFVEIAEKVARMSDLFGVSIVGSQNNIWIKPNRWKNTPTFTVEAAERGYDAVAQRMSYKQNARGDWERFFEDSERHYFRPFGDE